MPFVSGARAPGARKKKTGPANPQDRILSIHRMSRDEDEDEEGEEDRARREEAWRQETISLRNALSEEHRHWARMTDANVVEFLRGNVYRSNGEIKREDVGTSPLHGDSPQQALENMRLMVRLFRDYGLGLYRKDLNGRLNMDMGVTLQAMPMGSLESDVEVGEFPSLIDDADRLTSAVVDNSLSFWSVDRAVLLTRDVGSRDSFSLLPPTGVLGALYPGDRSARGLFLAYEFSVLGREESEAGSEVVSVSYGLEPPTLARLKADVDLHVRQKTGWRRGLDASVELGFVLMKGAVVQESGLLSNNDEQETIPMSYAGRFSDFIVIYRTAEIPASLRSLHRVLVLARSLYDDDGADVVAYEGPSFPTRWQLVLGIRRTLRTSNTPNLRLDLGKKLLWTGPGIEGEPVELARRSESEDGPLDAVALTNLDNRVLFYTCARVRFVAWKSTVGEVHGYFDMRGNPWTANVQRMRDSLEAVLLDSGNRDWLDADRTVFFARDPATPTDPRGDEAVITDEDVRRLLVKEGRLLVLRRTQRKDAVDFYFEHGLRGTQEAADKAATEHRYDSTMFFPTACDGRGGR